MSVTARDIQRLVSAGIIDAATGQRIEAFESERTRAARRSVPSLTELVVYLATAIVGAGVAVLVITNWENIPAPARIAIPLLAGIVAVVAGAWVGSSDMAASGRAKSVAWLLAAVLFVAATAVAASEAELSETNIALTAATVAMPVSVILWWRSRTHAQLAGIAGATFLLASAFASLTDDDAPTTIGVVLAAAGLLGLAVTEMGLLRPQITARILVGAAMAMGGFWAGSPPGPPIAELVAIVTTAILIGASVRFGTLIYTVFGVLGAFIGLVVAILRHIDSPTLAALALIAVGLALLVAIAAITRYRPWRMAHLYAQGSAPGVR